MEIFEAGIELSPLWLPMIGFIVGLLATMIGGNGAFFFPPILILCFQVSPRVAIATSLAAAIPIGLIGSFEHHRRTNINWPVGLVFGLAGFTGALSGAFISGLMDPATLVRSFGVYAILLGILTMRVPKTQLDDQIKPPRTLSCLSRGQIPVIICFGLISGLVAGLFGTSGTAPVLAGLFILRFPIKLVIGTSVMIVFINALSGFGGHLFLGEIDLELIGMLGSGAAVGAFLGPRLLSHMRPERKENGLRYVFAVLVMALGILLLVR